MDSETELQHARQAQAAQQLGKARVCARRAAGWAIRAWYQRTEGAGWRGDAVKQLSRLRDDPQTPEAIRQAAERLTTQVDENHELPFEADPVDDAQAIIVFVAVDKKTLISP